MTAAAALGAMTTVTYALHEPAAHRLGKADRVADDDAPALQALDPRLDGGPGKLEPAGRLRVTDAGVLAQQPDQGAVGGVEHRSDQSYRRCADVYRLSVWMSMAICIDCPGFCGR